MMLIATAQLVLRQHQPGKIGVDGQRLNTCIHGTAHRLPVCFRGAAFIQLVVSSTGGIGPGDRQSVVGRDGDGGAGCSLQRRGFTTGRTTACGQQAGQRKGKGGGFESWCHCNDPSLNGITNSSGVSAGGTTGCAGAEQVTAPVSGLNQ